MVWFWLWFGGVIWCLVYGVDFDGLFVMVFGQLWDLGCLDFLWYGFLFILVGVVCIILVVNVYG